MRKALQTISKVLFATLLVTNIHAQERPTLYAQKDNGIPAIPYEVTFIQPNGQQVRIKMKGDGAVHWAETMDGYKLVKNSQGAFCYAVDDSEKGMRASTVAASDLESRSTSERSFVKSLSKKVAFTGEYIARQRASKSMLKAGAYRQRAFPTLGNRKLLCLLIAFQDKPFSKTKGDFNNLFNLPGYNVNGSTGSVKDYFYDNSFQKMNLSIDVAGPYTVSKVRSYYGGNDASGNDLHPEEMVSEAVKLADADVDFSQYDNDKDGTIDGVYVIFAGNGEEAGAPADAIWSHASQITPVTLDGVRISAYSCSPELYGTSATTITSVGVICHEFSHVCGLPDYYDTDYDESGGESENLGNYDVMAGGSWNNNGKTPPYTNSYSRWMLGWGTLKEFTPQANNSILPHNSTSYGYKASTKANEYYIFENRQKVKWDLYIPGHGMIAYHVNYNATIWNNNEININPQKEYFELVDARKPANSATSPFPGTTNVTSFTKNTSPAFVNWDGSSLNTPLENITESGGVVTLNAKVSQWVTFKISANSLPYPNAKLTIGGQTYQSDVKGEVMLVVNLVKAAKYKVEAPGYAIYEGTVAASVADESIENIALLTDESSSFSITPSPVSELPIKVLSKLPKATIYIYDIGGRLITHQDIVAGFNTIDYQNIGSGIYIAKVISPNKSQSIKFVVL